MSGRWEDSQRKARLPANWASEIRPAVLKRDPVCRICHLRASVVADHIEPMKDDHRLIALQGLCDPCHRVKSAREGVAARLAKPGRKRPPESHPGIL